MICPYYYKILLKCPKLANPKHMIISPSVNCGVMQLRTTMTIEYKQGAPVFRGGGGGIWVNTVHIFSLKFVYPNIKKMKVGLVHHTVSAQCSKPCTLPSLQKLLSLLMRLIMPVQSLFNGAPVACSRKSINAGRQKLHIPNKRTKTLKKDFTKVAIIHQCTENFWMQINAAIYWWVAKLAQLLFSNIAMIYTQPGLSLALLKDPYEAD